ncbi:MAG TPA: hypothetical protein VFM69_13955 [Pricia sp.]|nr:hypothetical protein [Pricia sp.]
MRFKVTTNCLLHILTLLLFFSCSKSKDDLELNPIETGSLIGTLKLNDRFGNENLNYEDVSIDLIDAYKKTTKINVNISGEFVASALPSGNTMLNIHKPGYVGRDSIIYAQTESSVILPQIELLEKLPFSLTITDFSYTNGFLNYSTAIDFQTDENYLVSNLFCFGKSPKISINNHKLLRIQGGGTNVRYINSVIRASSSYDISNFLSNGFERRDTVYVVMYPVIETFGPKNYNQSIDFDNIIYNMDNTSNVMSFILK